jgi:hypothetical protein
LDESHLKLRKTETEVVSVSAYVLEIREPEFRERKPVSSSQNEI